MLCGVTGIRVREISIFRRLAFSTDGGPMEVVEEVIGFMAKMPGRGRFRSLCLGSCPFLGECGRRTLRGWRVASIGSPRRESAQH